MHGHEPRIPIVLTQRLGVHADKGGHGLMAWFISTYVPNAADRLDERASPMLRPSLTGLARALIICAEFDPLVDDNEAYALRLKEAGVPTRLEFFPGMHHPFFTLGAYIDDAAKAEDMIAEEIKALSGSPQKVKE